MKVVYLNASRIPPGLEKWISGKALLYVILYVIGGFGWNSWNGWCFLIYGFSAFVWFSVLGCLRRRFGASWRWLWRVLGRLEGVLGASWAILEASWESCRFSHDLKPSWRRRGSVLGEAWGRLGGVWETPGKRFRASLGCFFQSLKRIWSVLLEN